MWQLKRVKGLPVQVLDKKLSLLYSWMLKIIAENNTWWIEE